MTSIADPPHEPNPSVIDHASPERERLRGNLGPTSLLLMILAYNAPIAGAVGYISITIGYGNGLGAPLMYGLAAVMLGIFAAGFMKMARYVKEPGGFYSYITAGLGRAVGLGGAAVAALAYFLMLAGQAPYIGLSATQMVEVTLGGPSIHWLVYAFGTVLLVGILGYFHLDVSAKVLGALLVLEILVVAAYDVVVVAKGGATGLTGSFMDPGNIFSGSIGLGLLFAALAFAGFEATVVFRDEVRHPERTIPLATYGFIAFVAVVYGFTAWAIIQALGSDQAVAATAENPTGAVLGTFSTFLGRFGADVATVLLNTSIFAAMLTLHNILTRYIFKLSGDGVFPRSIAKTHPRHGSPHRASMWVSCATMAAVFVSAMAGADISVLYAQISGIGAYALFLLITVTSVAVIVYLNRNRGQGLSVWSRLIAPLIAFGGLLTLMILATLNINLLLGVSQELGLWICVGVFLLWLLGAFYALRLKIHRPKVYRTIGRQ